MDSKKVLYGTLGLIIVGGIFLLYYFFNPAQHSFFLPCPFKYLTGYHCPGCGSQRALHQLFHGDIAGAFSLNPLMILSLPLILAGLGTKLVNYFFDTQYRVALFFSKTFIYVYFGIAILYWVLRNLPFEPFTWLAPNGS